jgi:hypothetical protein
MTLIRKLILLRLDNSTTVLQTDRIMAGPAKFVSCLASHKVKLSVAIDLNSKRGALHFTCVSVPYEGNLYWSQKTVTGRKQAAC